MSDFIASAAAWISDFREATCSQNVVIRVPGKASGITCKATVTSGQTETMQQGVKIQTHYAHFIVKADVIKQNKIDIDRGLLIEWDNKQFEIAFDKRALWDWNDPHHNDIVIMTVYKKDLLCS